MEDSGAKFTHQGAQEIPFTATAGVPCVSEHMSACVYMYRVHANNTVACAIIPYY